MLLNARIKETGFAIKQKIGVYFILVTTEGQMSRSIDLRIVLKSINNYYIVKIATQASPLIFDRPSKGHFVKLCSELTS